MLGTCWGDFWFSERACFKGIGQRIIGEDTWYAPLTSACMHTHILMCRHYTQKCISWEDRVWMRRQKVKMVRAPHLDCRVWESSSWLQALSSTLPIYTPLRTVKSKTHQQCNTNMASLLHLLNLHNMESVTQEKSPAILKHNLRCQQC